MILKTIMIFRFLLVIYINTLSVIGISIYYLSQHCHDIPGLTIKRLYFELTGAVIYSHPKYAELYDNFHKNIHQSNSKSNFFKQNNKTNINHPKKSNKLPSKFVTVDETNFPQSYTSHKYRENHVNSTVITTKTTKLLKQSIETVTNDDIQLENKLNSKYPVNFSCEIYVHSRVNSRIMIRFQSFYIPSQQHLLCDENYLYLFDSNTPQYRAMAEAGGERGLCQHHFPTQPIFTTKSFVTIVFRSTTFSSSSMDIEPGFKLILTAITDAKSAGVCENNEFFCGHISVEPSQLSYMHRNKRSITNVLNSSDKTNSTDIQPLTTKQILQNIVQKNLSKVKSVKLKQRRSSKRKDYGYCISRLLQCDSIVHCHNARDELPSLRMNPSDLPHQLLHALVGAYLTPADLNNVGCTVYKLNNDPLINNNNKYTLVKSLFPSSHIENNRTNLSRFFSISSTANTLIIGCIILVSFVVIVFAYSCYQYCYRKKLRTIQIPNKSITYWSSFKTMKRLNRISQDHVKSNLTNQEQKTEMNKECFTQNGLGKYMIGRSATDGTLSTLAESYPGSNKNEKSTSDINQSSLYLQNRPLISQSISRNSLQSNDYNYHSNNNNNTKSVHFDVPNNNNNDNNNITQNSNQYYKAPYLNSINPQCFGPYCETIPFINQQQQIQINWQTNSQQLICYPIMNKSQMFTNCSQTLFHTSLYSNINNSETQMLKADIVPCNNLWRSASFGNETELLQPINNEFQTNIPYSMTTPFLPSYQHPLQCHHQYSNTTAPPPPPPYPKDHRLTNPCSASIQIKYHLEEFGKPDEYLIRPPSKLLMKNDVGKEQNTKMITNFNKKTGTKRVDNRKLYRRKHKEHLAMVNNHHYTKNDRNRHYILSVYSDGSVSESNGMYMVKHCGYRNKKHLKHFDSKAQVIDSDSPATTDVGITYTSKRSRKCINERFMHTEHIQRVSHSHKHKTCHSYSKIRPAKHTDLLHNKIQPTSGSLCNTANNDTECDKYVRDCEKTFDAKIHTLSSFSERYTLSNSESNPLNLSFLTRENTTNNMNRSFSSSDIPYTRHGEYI
ncbi:unnamed protein product [Schistosoma rodhaini]|uniref:CUB domain-containing protein n=2 Tax=Schistosoma rodhaini TaxID=6188 RepID=A0AA85EJL7_9TREM|nr:unnamed protein product [Schistosoma rodhaini]